ncbi:hypothetical protein ORI20_03205 [Mycobacterium sp. CVI_P3]|uniref:Scaffolding protein n=1 Tax=Mycobacterium pinniadriaticum TaxID=2994102 RepID=A0ABT3S868_9MYCO|nr:hypothetical protein [Mycobacterium pinniadriaticum]MCX2929268.1 hypothetical protein [Mycobacterium pinniadriaticum]MCX2935693.1 hypothetical protein [Mycobacterium pinniadriaticum]
MTDQATTPETAIDTTVTPNDMGEDTESTATDTTADATQDQDQVDDGTDAEESSPNAEAARWRKKLRETESQLETMAARVETLQRQQVDAQVSAAGVKPQAVYSVADLADLVGEDGSVDTEKVTEAVAKAKEQLGIGISKGSLVPGVGQRPEKPPQAENPWTTAFRPKAAQQR